MKHILPIFSGVLFAFSAQSQVQVLNEDFSAGIPSDWTIRIVDTNVVYESVAEYAPGWIGITDPEDPTNSIAASTSYFRYAGTANRMLITPNLQLGAFGNVLKWRARSHDPSYAEDYLVLISTTDTEAASFSDTLKLVNLEWDFWTDHEVNISELGYNSQNVHIAFVLKSYDGFKFYLDDVNLRKDDPVSVSENLAAAVAIYPNPSADFISVKGADVQSIRLISITGATVLSQSVLANGKIDVSALQAGAYIAELTSGAGVFRTRFVKQ